MFEKLCREDIRRAREKFQSLDAESADACSEIFHCAFNCAQRCILIGVFVGWFVCDVVDGIGVIFGLIS